MDTDDARTAARGEAEEDRLHQDPHRVRADAVRDADGRHPLQEVQFSFEYPGGCVSVANLYYLHVKVQTEPGAGGRQDPPEGQEGRPRHHSRFHPVAAAPETGESFFWLLCSLFKG